MKRSRSLLALALLPLLGHVALAAGGEPPVLTLEDALRRSLSHNPTVAAALAALDAQEQRVFQARAGFLPQANLSASYRRATLNQAVSPAMPAQYASLFPKPSMDSYDNLAIGLTVTQPIWDFGRTDGAYDSSKALRDASAEDLKAARESLWLAVTQAYYTVLATQELITAASDSKKQMEKHLELARGQAEAGIRQRIDVTRATSDLASAQLTLVKANNANRLARVALNNAMGLTDAGDYRVVRPASEREILVTSIDEAMREAIAGRPELRALQQKLRATGELVRVAQAGWYPTLGASLSWNNMAYKAVDLVKDYNWSLGATLTWNLFSGWQTTHAIQEAEANQHTLQATLDGFAVALRAEVESALLLYSEAREKITPAHALLDSAKETLFLAEGRYQAGTGNMVEVTDAQAVLTLASAGVIQAEYDIEIARARVLKALGRIPGAQGE